MEKKIILTLFELSGTFTKLYLELGFEVIQVDIQKDGSDVRLMKKIPGKVYGILAFPPCTHFAGSGARWWKDKGDEALLEGLSCVDAVLRMVQIYNPKFWALENPVGRLKHYIGEPKFKFQPFEFAGHIENWQDEAYTKKTCLWGSFQEPEKKPVENLHGSMMWSKYGGKSERTKTLRSKTPLGFAKAFVEANH